MAFHDSAWIRFFRQYGPVPTNENAFDEHIQKAARNRKMQAVSFDAEYLDELIANFKSDHPVSIILTGAAGDGKTYYCRQIWEALGGSRSLWEEKREINALSLSNRQMIVIKDLSAISLEDAQRILPQVAESIINQDTERVYLIAANDGQLMERWREIPSSSLITSARRSIENLLVNEQREQAGVDLRLYNLGRLPIRNIFPRILNAVLQHEGWQICEECPFRRPSDATKQCPIWENKERIERDETTQTRLIQLLELCELNNVHLTVRQLLLLVANMLLGHPGAKDHLMTCKDAIRIIDDGTTALGSVYRNIFGENLGKRRRQSREREVFTALNRFGIGNETNSRIDKMLIFGKDDPDQLASYQRFVLNDPYYGADSTYQSQQTAYLEGTTDDNGEKFLSMLRTQRQRLFFTIARDAEKEMKLWSLTVFQYAGEYLEIVQQLRQETTIASKVTLARLIQGLNRIFTGLLVRETDQLILATSGSYSQARVCHILEEYVSVTKKQGQQVILKFDSDYHRFPLLIVSLGKGEQMKIPLRLQLTRFEFLCRVADGVLPSSFSRECYEDILSFKTKLLRQLDYRRRIDEDDVESELELKMIYLDTDGDIKDSTLEVQFS